MKRMFQPSMVELRKSFCLIMGSFGSSSVPFKYGTRGSGSMDYINYDSDDSCRPVGHGEGSIGKVWASQVDAEKRRMESSLQTKKTTRGKKRKEPSKKQGS